MGPSEKFPWEGSEYKEILPDTSIQLGNVDTFRDSRNVMRTKSLFLEAYQPFRWKDLKVRPFFTLRDYNYGPFLSLRQLYMNIGDRTEYTFAMSTFGSFELWNNICTAKWFSPHITVWRSDLEAKLKSEAFETIKTIATQTKSPGTALAAAKFLLKEEWKADGVTKKVLKKDAKEKIDELNNETIGSGLNTSDIMDSMKRSQYN